MSKRDVLSSPRLKELKKRRRRTFLNKILISLLGFLAVFILAAYLSRLNALNINEVRIYGNKTVDTEMIKEAVEREIAGKYLWLFPKTNILYYPQNGIKNDLWNKFKRIKDINLSIKNNKILEVSLGEREAKYIWCGNTIPTGTPAPGGTDQGCYFLDEDGYVFDQAPYYSGNVYFKFYGLTDAPQNDANFDPLGSHFFKQNFKQLISFKDILVGIGLKPVMLYLTDTGDINIYLSRGISPADDPEIILDANADFQNVAENLETALSTEPLQSKFKNSYSSLQYIDLRFGNRVFYKFQ